jgi:hypothetical protein
LSGFGRRYCVSVRRSTLGGRHRTPSFQNVKRPFGFSIFSLPCLERFPRCIVPPVLRKLLLIDFDPLATMLDLVDLAHFFRHEKEFQFCTPDKFIVYHSVDEIIPHCT